MKLYQDTKRGRLTYTLHLRPIFCYSIAFVLVGLNAPWSITLLVILLCFAGSVETELDT